MTRLAPVAVFVCGLAFGSCDAQVAATYGVPGGARIVDFDFRQVPLGPISGTDPIFRGLAIEEIQLIPTWSAGGDVLSAGSNVEGRALVSQNGAFSVAEVGDPLDNPGAGAGLEITFTSTVRRFGLRFVDEVGMDYTVELFVQGISLGAATFTYTSATGGFPAPPVYWEDIQERRFDRIVITSTNGGGGWGIDDLAMVLDVCGGDCDGNTTVNIFDFLCFQDAFVQQDPYADCDGNGTYNLFDFLCYQDMLASGCP
jgi:hypothetical protein